MPGEVSPQRGTPPSDTSTDADWRLVHRCPSCGGAGQDIGALFNQTFRLGSALPPPPPEPIHLHRCTSCGLVYKTCVPTPGLLARLTADAQAELWVQRYDYAPEIAALRSIPSHRFDNALDIGAAGGDFLDALPEGGRRSALDIVRFDGLRINGEFISAFLEDADIAWSGDRYDLVGLFDIAEHLYWPKRAFANLRDFCTPGALVIVETGDTASQPEARLKDWSYLNLLEHHIGWNREALEACAEEAGFRIERFDAKRHKSHVSYSWRMRLKGRLFALAPRLVQRAYAMARRPFNVPGYDEVDHMRFILRAI